MTHQPYNTIFISIFLIFTISVNAQKFNFTILGNSHFSDEFYSEVLPLNSVISKENILFKLTKNLLKEGYYNFNINKLEIDTLSDSTINITLSIEENKPTFIRNIYVDSLMLGEADVEFNELKKLKNEIFKNDVVELEINNLITNFENSGFPFTSIRINSVNFIHDSSNYYVDLYISINKNEIRKIDKVEISGNEKTKDYVIINAARLKKGDYYSQEKINNIPQMLNKLRFFKKVDTPKYYVNTDNEGILQLSIVEKNTNTFDGILGYVPANDKENSGYFTGFINISLRNLFGTGRALSIKWKQENSLTQEMELKYLEPWVFNQPFNLGFQFYQRRQDSNYVKRVFSGDLEFLATENIAASLLFETESIIPSINNNTTGFRKSSSFNSGIKLNLDYRDDIISPTSGIIFTSVYKFRSKKFDKTNDDISLNNLFKLEYNNYELDFGIFYSFFNAQVLALGIHAKEIVGDFFDISDYFQFGGTNSLRGYRENQFLGNRIFWSNLEYRFLLSQSSYVFGFYDVGYFLIEKNDFIGQKRTSELLNGYGVGISLETALGVMRVSYAIGEGASIGNGLIHFGILNDF